MKDWRRRILTTFDDVAAVTVGVNRTHTAVEVRNIQGKQIFQATTHDTKKVAEDELLQRAFNFLASRGSST